MDDDLRSFFSAWLCGGLALLLPGCGAEVAITRGVDPASIESRTQWLNVAGMDRTQVIARIGEPWIADPARRVDVFRTSEKQQNVLLVFMPVPVPVPAFSREFSGYSLVSYAPDGTVDGADHVFAVSRPAGLSPVDAARVKPAAHAGDYEFMHPSWPSGTMLSVTLARWIKDRAIEPRSASECTLVSACDMSSAPPPAEDGTSGNVCWSLLRVDGNDVGQAVVSVGWNIVDPADARPRAVAAAGPRAGTVHCPTPKGCGLVAYLSTAIQLPAGTHELSYRSPSIEGSADAQLACKPGEVWYARLGGKLQRKYSLAEQAARGMALGVADGKVELSREWPPAAEPPWILLWVDGKPLGGRGAP